MRLDVPDTHGRYYVLQFVDAWTNNFAYVGHRATGTEAGSFLLVAPGWDGEAPDGARVIRLPTNVATIVGRWAVDGEARPARVAALQAADAHPDAPRASACRAVTRRCPRTCGSSSSCASWMQAFPPAERDQAYQHRFAPLGLLEPRLALRRRRAATRRGAARRAGDRRQKHGGGADEGPSPVQNGWNLTYHVFDYNLDFFEVGALDDAAWKLDDGPARYMQRALAARAGLWGNHGYEAAYAMVYLDGDGDAAGRHHALRAALRREPPGRRLLVGDDVRQPDFFLVANPIDRYSIGDRTPGLHARRRRRPDDRHAARAAQRARAPRQLAADTGGPVPADPADVRARRAVFDGGYELPPITRLARSAP